MSKIALIAGTGGAVDRWRRTTGIAADLAPWVMTETQAREWGPFSSVLRLPGWEEYRHNETIYAYVVAQITAARLGENAAGEARLVAQINEGEWFFPEGQILPLVDRPRPAATFPSTPPLTENERVLQEFGVNPALIGMLEDNVQNLLVREVREEPINARLSVEQIAGRRGIRPWGSVPATPQAARDDALRIVQEFYGTNAHFQTMNDSRLFACRDLARRGLSATTLNVPEIMDICRSSIARILREHAEEEISRAAGFLDPDTGPPAERTPGDGYEPPAYREAPARRAYSDPLRDHLRSFMREERGRGRRN